MEPSSSGSTSTLKNIVLRQSDKVYLIGHVTHQISGAKLPSEGQVLKSLFYNLRHVKKTVKDAAKLTISEVLLFWEKAKIPTRQTHHCVSKLEKLYEEWRNLQKNASRVQSVRQKEKIESFKSTLDDLFDIAHNDALQLIKVEEDRQFLLLQRQKGRPGSMVGVDLKLLRTEARKEKRKASEIKRREGTKEKQVEQDVSDRDLSFSSSEEESDSDSQEPAQPTEQDDDEINSPDRKRKKLIKGTTEVLTEKLSVTLDRCNISDRDAVRILFATAEALGHDPVQLKVSKSTIRRRRQNYREERSQLIKNRFKNSNLESAVLHWDGKLLPSILNREISERLAIIISSGDEEHLIGIPQLENSTGSSQADAIHEELVDWAAEDKIEAMCFDTTAVNTGRLRGVCVLLERLLGKDLMYLPCRHHILEVILKAVFDCRMGLTSGPQPDFFKQFHTAWSKIDQTKFKSGLQDELVKDSVENIDEICSFLLLKMQEEQPRHDYREFLELCLIFLGARNPGEITFRAPGAMHHARWMAKGIYSLKMFLFRDQFPMTEQERSGLRDICLFIVNIYVRAWFNAPKAQLAPKGDLNLVENLIRYRGTNLELANIALGKLLNHLWYLNPENVCFALFDDTVSHEEKRSMSMEILSALYESEAEIDIDRVIRPKISLADVDLLLTKELGYFVSSQSHDFFRRLKISTSFLNSDPESWCEDPNYMKGKGAVEKLRVVNDTAERGVKLIQDFNSSITRNEMQKQYLLQVVSECRQVFPDTSKATLAKQL